MALDEPGALAAFCARILFVRRPQCHYGYCLMVIKFKRSIVSMLAEYPDYTFNTAKVGSYPSRNLSRMSS